jgi:FAD/FMN-containing dehydrogenase
MSTLAPAGTASSARSSGNAQLIADLKKIIGSRHVLTSPASTRRFRKGFRTGEGPALAVVLPGTLVEQWRVLNACAATGKIVIMQAANTGLTGGSTPDGDQYDRDIVIISTLRIAKIHLIDGGQQVICLPGATLFELENLLHPLGRDPHSVIGSSCIGASVFGGLCNNSGGALIQRGPAFTQMTLYAQIDEAGKGEYLHRGAFAIAESYGKDMFLAIQYLGTGWLPMMFAAKGRLDGFCTRFKFIPHDLSDRIMQGIGSLFRKHLPKRLYDYHERFEHHLMLRMAGGGIEEARAYLSSIFPSAHGSFFECTPDEGAKAFLHRFATAGAAVRYRAIHRKEVEDIVALDIALPRNETDWFEHLPEDIASRLLHKLYYGHFFCQVFHQDYIVKKGHDPLEIEHAMWKILDSRGAEYPAEHNVGHLYVAKPALLNHYRSLDPSNSFNPGIGHTSKHAHWA